MIGAAGYAGLATLAALWSMPLWLDWAAFPLHMARHVGLVAVAAPLLVLGIAPVARWFALSPVLAAAVEFVVVWGWHLPGSHAAARLSSLGFVAEQAMFLGAGLLVWAGALRRGQELAGAGGLLLTSMHMTLLGALLVLASRDVYAALCGTAPDIGGQRLGGLLMLAVATPIYLVVGLMLVRRALDTGARTA